MLLVLATTSLNARAFAQPFPHDNDGLLDVGEAPGFPAIPEASTGPLDLSDQNIEDLDGTKLLTSLHRLDLSNNRIASLESGDFDGLDRLRVLSLGENQISSLDNVDLRGLSRLEVLSLSDNQITHIEPGYFDGFSGLDTLSLGGNEITNLESGAFQGLSDLRWLNLRDNQITSLDGGTFDGFNDLERLDLRANQITSLSHFDFHDIGTLQSLILRDNQITSLDRDDFDGLDSVGSLNLGGNQITRLGAGDFDGFVGRLWLDNNQLTSVTSDALHGNVLSKLVLSNNLITRIEPGAFAGSNNLETLVLDGNDLTELDFTGATFEHLSSWGFEHGLVVDSNEIVSLLLDGAVLSLESFLNIVDVTNSISDVSLVGLAFSDEYPSDLGSLLDISTLDNVAVDSTLFDRYAPEFDAFAAMSGNTVTVVPEPSGIGLLISILILTAVCLRPHRQRQLEDRRNRSQQR